MLILTRRIGEVLRINDNVGITILDINGSQVRIGIQAPKDVSVHREEIYRKLVNEDGSLNKLGKLPVVDEDEESVWNK